VRDVEYKTRQMRINSFKLTQAYLHKKAALFDILRVGGGLARVRVKS
jgi:hypothetical protein